MIIRCPECSGEMSDMADFCPTCGWVPGKAERIAEQQASERYRRIQHAKEMDRLARARRVKTIAWAVFLLTALGLMIWRGIYVKYYE